ncbi:MAG TPA: DUF4253 domain-containing protein [Planktothrix sp.]|jgi:hypothetical protein
MAVAELKERCAGAGLDCQRLADISPGDSTRKVYSIVVPGAEAMDAWKKLRRAVDETGFWPVIAGSVAEFKTRDLGTLLAKLHDTPEMIQRGNDVNVFDWLTRALTGVDFREQEVAPEVGIAMHKALDKYTNNFNAAGLSDFEDTAMKLGVNPDGWFKGEYTCLHCPQAKIQPTSEEDLIGYKNILTDKPYESVVLLLVPTKTPWEVAAYLSLGHGHDRLKPYEHFALHKFWHENYGAEIITSTSDTVEMLVSRPPNSLDDAQRVAQQQFAYAPDIVNHGTGKTSALAAQLLDGKTWYFWWD